MFRELLLVIIFYKNSKKRGVMQIRLTRNPLYTLAFVASGTIYYASLNFVKIINTLKLSFRGNCIYSKPYFIEP